MNKEKAVDWVTREGHEIASAMRNCKSLEEFKEMRKRIGKFMDFCTEKFGEPSDEQIDEKHCPLNTELGVACAWRETTFDPKYKDNKDTMRLFLSYLDDFERVLESKYWARGER